MKRSWMVLIGVCILVFLLRVGIAFQSPVFASDDAYLHVRYVEHILETGKPLWEDSLGYGGRTLVLSPVFDYVLAFFALFMPVTVALKVFPSIFASLVVFPVFLIARRVSKKEWVALLAAALGGIVPVFFATTVNHVSPLSLVIPLFMFMVYAWMRVPNKGWVITFLACLLFFVFLHPLSLVLMLGIGVYVGLAMAENFRHSKAELELALFSIFFALWAQFLLYKKLILFHGPAVIWQNIPSQLLSAHFAHITVLGAMWQIGLFPLLGGTYVLYKYVFREHKRDIYVLFSFTAAAFVLLWLRLISLNDGLVLIGVLLVALFSDWCVIFVKFVRKTKVAKWTTLITKLCMILVIATSVFALYTETRQAMSSTIQPEEVAALEWLNERTEGTATVIAPVEYGNYITAISGNKDVIDSYFLLQERAEERLTDVNRVYQTALETEAVRLFNKYGATYLYIPPGRKDIGFADSKCFYRVYAKNVRIYEKDVECQVRVVS